ncbi:protein DPCD-like isoform X2 [Lineus longissimus]
MAEEYDISSQDLVVRKWKKKTTLGGGGAWTFEVGESVGPKNLDAEGLVESSTNPIFVRKDTRKAYQWRIRNIPYPLETYDVKVNPEDRCIVVRTSNKKYYKKFDIPDMDRMKLALEQQNLKIAHANNTLIITYDKPAEILTMEENLRKQMKTMKSMQDGDVECNPS